MSSEKRRIRPQAFDSEVPPPKAGPRSIRCRDTCSYQERINLITKSGLFAWLQRRRGTGARFPFGKRRLRICEIGGGYGAVARWFCSPMPDTEYTIIDLPESLLFSELYLILACPAAMLRFVPNYKAEELTTRFDIVLNTLSMSEVSGYQVRRYAALMRETWLRNGGIFFEQNQDNRAAGLLAAQERITTELPYKATPFPPASALRNGQPNPWGCGPIDLAAR